MARVTVSKSAVLEGIREGLAQADQEYPGEEAVVALPLRAAVLFDMSAPEARGRPRTVYGRHIVWGGLPDGIAFVVCVGDSHREVIVGKWRDFYVSKD